MAGRGKMGDDGKTLVQRAQFAVPAMPSAAAGKAVRKRKRKVLEEDDYVCALEKIIQRDFFPDLPKLRAQLEYLTAVEENDIAKMQAVSRRYQTPTPSGRAGQATPAGFETPASFDGGATPRQDAPFVDEEEAAEEGSTSINTTLSLDAFLNRYTSEDNESFEEILEVAKARLRSKYAWAYEKTEKQQRQLSLTQGDVDRKALERAKGQYMAIETWRYTPRNSFMYAPTDVELTPAEQLERSKKQREIKHANTRFREMPFPETLTHGGTSTGSPVAGGLPAAVTNAMVQVRGVAPGSPRVNGYGFIATPLGGDQAWGTIGGTAFPLDGSDTPRDTMTGPHFTIPRPNQRERLTHEMVDKIKTRQRKQDHANAATARHAVTPRSVSSSPAARLAQMSPAAQRLVRGMVRKSTSGFSGALRASYSGNTPDASPQAAARPLTSHTVPGTPIAEGASITDNLL